MNYIGSKNKLSAFITQAVHQVAGADLSQMVLCDLFAGTGIVGRNFKQKVRKVISNDLEYYSYVLNRNYIGNSQPIPEQNAYIEQLNQVPLLAGFIYKHYSKGGHGDRQYFSDKNAMKIDAIRTRIEQWKQIGAISDDLYFFLLASLLESADKVANTASVYGAYLKKLKKSAQNELVLQAATFTVDQSKHQVYNEDSNVLIDKIKGDILYLDPPYNSRQYGANYHLLNTIALYDSFTPKGKTGLRTYNKSAYSSKQNVKNAFEELIKKADFKYIFLSYNNEGLLSVNEIKNLMQQHGEYRLLSTTYQRFKADKDSNRTHLTNKTEEYLHILIK